MSSNRTEMILRDHPDIELDPTMPIPWYRIRDESTCTPAFLACDSSMRQSALFFNHVAGQQQEVKDTMCNLEKSMRDEGGMGTESRRIKKHLEAEMEQIIKLHQATLEETMKVQASLEKFEHNMADNLESGSNATQTGSAGSPEESEQKQVQKV